jgi:hypothetical protein
MALSSGVMVIPMHKSVKTYSLHFDKCLKDNTGITALILLGNLLTNMTNEFSNDIYTFTCLILENVCLSSSKKK